MCINMVDVGFYHFFSPGNDKGEVFKHPGKSELRKKISIHVYIYNVIKITNFCRYLPVFKDKHCFKSCKDITLYNY